MPAYKASCLIVWQTEGQRAAKDSLSSVAHVSIVPSKVKMTLASESGLNP